MNVSNWSIGILMMGLCACATAYGHPGHDEVESPFERHRRMKGFQERMEGRVLLAERGSNENSKESGENESPGMAAAFDPFVKLKAIKTRWDEEYFYIESNGIPEHQMMVGIRSWQQQVPIPQKYEGTNAWQVPLHPNPAKNPATTKNRFLRGAIAIGVNGIPIFNPLNNRGDDAYKFGELDEFGGHCGRADDYHYHLAPVHLEKVVGKGKPLAYALDGYPIYGYEEPDGSEVKNLDALNGHKDAAGNYHYHATKDYPYLNGGFHGEVVEREGQVDPQPRAEPIRPALPPMQGAKITDFQETKPGSFQLIYEMRGEKGEVHYTLNKNGSVDFQFVDPSGNETTESYSPQRRGGGRNPPPPQGREGRRPGRGGKPLREEVDSPPPLREGEVRRGKGTEQGKVQDQSKGSSLKVTSSSVDENGRLSVDCTCDGKGESPAVSWEKGPKGTKAYAVSLWHTAPDQEKSYWVVYNIPANVTQLKQNSKGVGRVGMNDRRKGTFDPMCSKGPGVKTYHVTVYALSKELDLPASKVSRAELLKGIEGITLGSGTLDFEYERQEKRP